MSKRFAPAMDTQDFAHSDWEILPSPSGHGGWLKRVQGTAEDLGIIPVGLEEFEFNVAPDRIVSIEFWSGWPRTPGNHTEVPIPARHQPVFANFAKEFSRMIGRP